MVAKVRIDKVNSIVQITENEWVLDGFKSKMININSVGSNIQNLIENNEYLQENFNIIDSTIVFIVLR